MKAIWKFIFLFWVSLLSLFVIKSVVSGVTLPDKAEDLALLALLFAALHATIGSFLRFVLTPVILITFGLGIIIVYGAVFYLLDYLSEVVIIHGVESLIYISAIMAALSFFVRFSAKKAYKD